MSTSRSRTRCASSASLRSPASIDHLHGGRTAREHARPRTVGHSVEIDRDVDLEIAHEMRELRVAALAGIDEALEGGLEAAAHRARLRLRRRDRDRLETAPVVMLEQAGGELRNRMVGEIGRQI